MNQLTVFHNWGRVPYRRDELSIQGLVQRSRAACLPPPTELSTSPSWEMPGTRLPHGVQLPTVRSQYSIDVTLDINFRAKCRRTPASVVLNYVLALWGLTVLLQAGHAKLSIRHRRHSQSVNDSGPQASPALRSRSTNKRGPKLTHAFSHRPSVLYSTSNPIQSFETVRRSHVFHCKLPPATAMALLAFCRPSKSIELTGTT
jgi:hypothetical protein